MSKPWRDPFLLFFFFKKKEDWRHIYRTGRLFIGTPSIRSKRKEPTSKPKRNQPSLSCSYCFIFFGRFFLPTELILLRVGCHRVPPHRTVVDGFFQFLIDH